MGGKGDNVIIVRKKRHGRHGHHGGAWKVAYADFVTAMMAFFLVLWIVGQSKEVKQAVAGYFRNPGIFDQQRSDGPIAGGQLTLDEKTDPPQPQKPALLEEEERAALEKTAERIR